MKYRGFTLAEVLITLSIIGVVAAMTMPVLINRVGDKVLESQRKRAQSVVANGAKMLIAQTSDVYLSETDLKSCGNNSNCIASEIKKVFKVIDDNSSENEVYNTKYIFENGEFSIWKDSGMNYVFVTPDGMIFGVSQNNKSSDSLTVYGDVNGSKSPNKGSKDVCIYFVADSGTVVENCPSEFTKTCSATNFTACKKEECQALGSGFAWVTYLANPNAGFCTKRLPQGGGTLPGDFGRI